MFKRAEPPPWKKVNDQFHVLASLSGESARPTTKETSNSSPSNLLTQIADEVW